MTIIGRKAGIQLPALSEPRQSPLAALPALQFARAEKSPSTRRAYRSDFDAFRKWCAPRKLNALPASAATFAIFVASEAKRGVKAATIARRVAGVNYAHLMAGHTPPGQSEIVKATVRGIRRTIGAAPNCKEPLTAEMVCTMVKRTPHSLIDLRDRALLLLGFAGAMRRSELVGLNLNDLKHTKDGLRIRIRASKTDEERIGHVVAIAPGKIACPVKALKAWVAAAKITSGPIFRAIFNGGRISAVRLSDRAVAEIVKKHAKRIGLDPASFSAHSLRSGFLTSAAQNGASIFKMMDVSRHKRVDTVRGYIRDTELFRDHAGAGLL